jgi:hypothetical protein
MNNRSLIYMTGIVIVGVAILLGINLFYTFRGTLTEEVYLGYNSIRGSAIEHQGKLYTLNFDQQKALIEAINRSVRIADLPKGGKKPDFTKIVIYRFNAPDVMITPIAFVDGNLVYSAPQLIAPDYLMELSRGQLEKLLSQTYDH